MGARSTLAVGWHYTLSARMAHTARATGFADDALLGKGQFGNGDGACGDRLYRLIRQYLDGAAARRRGRKEIACAIEHKAADNAQKEQHTFHFDGKDKEITFIFLFSLFSFYIICNFVAKRYS